MSAEVSIRPAEASDREVLLRFHRSLYVDHRERVVSTETLPLIAYRDYERVLEEDLDSLLSDGASRVLVAEQGQRPVGYVSGRVRIEERRALPKRGTIEDWWVEPYHRGQGVGKALLGAIEAFFRDVGCEVVESGTWSSNAAAREVHDALGFREIRITYRKRL